MLSINYTKLRNKDEVGSLTLPRAIMECKKQTNLKKCNCTYPSCSRKGMCCECLRYHLINKELPACCFPKDVEKTYDRSFKNFAKLVFDSRQKSEDF